MVITITTLGILGTLLAMNFYNRYKTMQSVDQELKKMNWKTLSQMPYIKKSYELVGTRFSKVNKCWLEYPWRNMYFTNMWQLKGKGLPCHMQNNLFQRFISKKVKKQFIKTKATYSIKKSMVVHFYSRIKIKNKWLDIDVWGKHWGIPFGKNVHNSKWQY